MSDEPTIVAFVPDLMDRSRFGALAKNVTFVTSTSDLSEHAHDADIIVIDLSRPGALEAVAMATGARKVGFASHVDAEILRSARAADVDAMPRSRFFSRVASILTQDNH